ELVDSFETKHGRSPNGLELDRLSQQATLMTRRAKSHTGETREEMLDRIDAKIRSDIDGGLAGVARAVLDARDGAPAVQEWSPQEVIELALEEVKRAKSGWNRGDLTAAINAALPDYLGLPDGTDVSRLLDTLTEEGLRYATTLDAARPGDESLPDELRLRNGRSVYEAPGARLYATPDQVRTERALVAATTGRGATALPAAAAARFVEQLRESGIELGVDQAAAVRGVLTSGARVECLIGPAGTGKSFVVGALARAWTDPAHVPTADPDEVTPGHERRVFGLATSQIATEILAAEGLTARNVTRWLDTQTRLAAGPGAGGPRPVDGDQAWRLHAGDLVVVDESAMTDTASLAAIHEHVDAAGAKLLLVGDHRQLSAIGAGGAMDLLARAGTRYELTDARRFTHDWERDASLRLRAGDETVLHEYHQQGRLLDAGTREEAEASAARAWLADTVTGRDSVLLVDDNTAAARLSGQLRAELVRLGRVTEHGVPLAQGTVAGVGDLVQARWNGWNLAGIEGNRRGPINRETYLVTDVRDDGTLEVRAHAGPDVVGPDGEPIGQRLVLPASYVAEHLALAYASTVHAAQGRTTDTSHAVITGRTSHPALYVAMSRGRDANTAHVATTTTIEDPAQGRPDQTVHRNPMSLLAGIMFDRDQVVGQSATALAAESAANAESVQSAGERLADAVQLAATERTVGWLDQLTTAGHLTADQRARLAAEDGAPSLTRVLRRAELAGLDARQALVDAVTERPLAGANNTTNVLVARLTNGGTRRFDPVGDTWADWVPATGRADWDAYLGDLARAADERTDQLGRDIAAEPPTWATEALGPVPTADDARADWACRAGIVAGYRELRGQTDPTDALGRPPAPARQAEAYAAYRAAWTALGKPEAQQAEHEMSTAQHLMRIRAAERDEAWGPRYVGNELAGTRQAATQHHQTAALRGAEATNAVDPTERERLTREAAEATALAETLDAQAAALDRAEHAYLRHRVSTAANRGAADISKLIIAERNEEPEPRVTAAEWLAAHEAAVSEDDRYRAVTDHDVLADSISVDDRAADVRGLVIETEIEPDLREVAAVEPRQTREDVVQVPAADQMATTVDHARRALHEIEARKAYEQRAEQDQRAEQLGRWHGDDQSVHDDFDVDERDDEVLVNDGSEYQLAGWE
ncbi:MAG: AAA family ATPase, partial [Pseudonocardia sp.]|nr:AAA family ATPase [Pseudonocardia sp.]